MGFDAGDNLNFMAHAWSRTGDILKLENKQFLFAISDTIICQAGEALIEGQCMPLSSLGNATTAAQDGDGDATAATTAVQDGNDDGEATTAEDGDGEATTVAQDGDSEATTAEDGDGGEATTATQDVDDETNVTTTRKDGEGDDHDATTT